MTSDAAWNMWKSKLMEFYDQDCLWARDMLKSEDIESDDRLYREKNRLSRESKLYCNASAIAYFIERLQAERKVVYNEAFQRISTSITTPTIKDETQETTTLLQNHFLYIKKQRKNLEAQKLSTWEIDEESSMAQHMKFNPYISKILNIINTPKE